MNKKYWNPVHFCATCSGLLTGNVKAYHYSQRMCPLCGCTVDCENNIPITTVKAGRFVVDNPFWKFWKKRGHWEYK